MLMFACNSPGYDYYLFVWYVEFQLYFRDKNNDLIVLKDPCGSAGLLKQAAGRTPTRADVHGALLCKDVLCRNDRRDRKEAL